MSPPPTPPPTPTPNLPDDNEAQQAPEQKAGQPEDILLSFVTLTTCCLERLTAEAANLSVNTGVMYFPRAHASSSLSVLSQKPNWNRRRSANLNTHTHTHSCTLVLINILRELLKFQISHLLCEGAEGWMMRRRSHMTRLCVWVQPSETRVRVFPHRSVCVDGCLFTFPQ